MHSIFKHYLFSETEKDLFIVLQWKLY